MPCKVLSAKQSYPETPMPMKSWPDQQGACYASQEACWEKEVKIYSDFCDVKYVRLSRSTAQLGQSSKIIIHVGNCEQYYYYYISFPNLLLWGNRFYLGFPQLPFSLGVVIHLQKVCTCGSCTVWVAPILQKHFVSVNNQTNALN